MGVFSPPFEYFTKAGFSWQPWLAKTLSTCFDTARDDTRDRDANSSRQLTSLDAFFAGETSRAESALPLAFAAAKIKNIPLVLEKKSVKR